MELNYASNEAAQKALDMEAKFLKLPPQAGVVFVGIKPIPAPGGRVTSYDVRMGIRRPLEESLGQAIIKEVLKDELADGIHFQIAVYRGIAGTSTKALDTSKN